MRWRSADRIVLPGVGAFADCRRGLDAIAGMVEALDERVRDRRPAVPRHLRRHAADGRARARIRGHATASAGSRGEVDRIAPADPTLKIPHMGWNTLERDQAASAARRHPGRAAGPARLFRAFAIICSRPTAPTWWRRPITAARSPPSSGATPSSAPSSIPRRASGSGWR